MKETVPQKSLEPVLHGFLLKERKADPSSKTRLLSLLGILSTQEI
ncbi:MAG: hypothetical protein ACP5N0_02995 [Methanosarcina sp.]|jgi:hypothetical protein